MRKILSSTLLLLLTVTMSLSARTAYKAGRDGRVAKTELATGKKYLIYNTARQYFIGASSATAYSISKTTSIAADNENFMWTLEASDGDTYKIKNVGANTYCAGGTTLGAEAKSYTIGEYSTCPSKGAMAAFNEDGSQTAAADITASDNAVYVCESGTTAYWNGTDTGFNTHTAAHVYILYDIEKLEQLNFITELSEATNTVTYTVTAPRSAWAVNEDGDTFTTIKALGLEASKEDVKQQFAFIKPENSENYYLYSVSAKKYVGLAGELTDVLADMYPVYFADASNYKANHVRTYFDAQHNIDLTNADPPVVTVSSWGYNDDGTVYFIEVASTDFDPTEALEVFNNLCVVTYELYDDGGSEIIATAVVDQNKGSEIAIPASLKNEKYFTYRTEGTIGNNATATIKVYRILKEEIAYPQSNIANNTKVYRIEVPRGTFTTTDGKLANTVKNQGYAITNFAILSDGTNSYLWSVNDKRFVGSDGNLTVIPAAITFEECSLPFIKIHYGSNTINASGNYETGVIINAHNTNDEGNTCVFFEAGDFNTADIAEAYDVLIEMLSTRFGDELGQYHLEEGDTNATLEELKNNYSAANYTKALGLMNAGEINKPKAGSFLRIKGTVSNKYLAEGNSSNGNRFNMTNAEDATTLFYYDGSTLLNYNSGLYNGMTASSWSWVVGSENASVVSFIDGLTNGGYVIQSATAYFYDAGKNTIPSADRGGTIGNIATANVEYRSWAPEYVNALPVTIGKTGWATFSAPVATIIPSGVTAYTAKANGDVLTLTAIEGNIIPKETGVLLKGEENTAYDFAITTGGAEVENDFQASIGVTSVEANSVYVLANKNDVLGFYLLNSATMPGFKAYVSKSAANANGFYSIAFGDDDITGIAGAETSAADQNATYYDIQGRRVAAPQKGQLYIVNGKKVLY